MPLNPALSLSSILLHHNRVGQHTPRFTCDTVTVQEGQFIWLAMELAGGGDLDDQFKEAVKSKQIIREDLIGGWACGCVNALGFLHENNVVHRDIKLANLMLDGNGQIKLCDFGMAAEIRHGEWLEEYGKGTPLYQSPELCERRPYNEKVDTWAMGCVLYELAARQRPFDGKNMVTISKKICTEKPKPLRSGYGSDMQKFVMSLLTKDIHDRPSMIELLGTPFISHHMAKMPPPREEKPPEPSPPPEPVPSSGTTRSSNRFLKDRPVGTQRANGRRGSGSYQGSPDGGANRRRGSASTPGNPDGKKKTVDILKRFSALKQKVAKDELFSESGASASQVRAARRAATPVLGQPLFHKGQQCLYTRTNEVRA